MSDLRLVHADTGEAYLTGFNPDTYEYTFVVPSTVSNSKMAIGALLSDAAPEGSTITMKYANYYNLTGSKKSVAITSSATENVKGSKFSSFVSANSGNSCTIEVGVEGNLQTYTLNIYRYEGIKLSKTELTIPVGSTPVLTVSKGFGVGTDDAVTWSSSDESVAAVADGVITAKGTGTATITAASGTYTAACAVTVKPVEEMLVGRNEFGYLKDFDITQSNRNNPVDFEFDSAKLWQEFEVNSNDGSIFFVATANEKYADDYGSIVVNTECSTDGGATWTLDSSSKYDKNILNDGTVSAMFQTITVGENSLKNFNFPLGETLLMRVVAGKYTPVTAVTGATAENSDVYYFKVTQRAALGGIAVADSEGNALPLNQEFEASNTDYVVKNFSGDTVSITPSLGRAATDCKVYIDGKEAAAGTAAALKVSDLPVNEYNYHYVTIDVKYEGSGVGSDETYKVVFAPGDYTPVITTPPVEMSCTQGDDVYMKVEASAPEGKGTLTYSWKSAPNKSMWNAADLGTTTDGSIKLPTESSGTKYVQCTIVNVYNGVSYELKTDVVKVEIAAKTASEPVIDINRSDFSLGGTYYLNAASEFPLYTLATSPDQGAVLTYEWFRTDRADYTNADGSEAESVGPGKIQWIGTSAIGSVQCLYPVMDKEGTFYYFCKITSTITLPDGTTTSTSINSPLSNAFTVNGLDINLAGSGTEEDPYQITSAADMDHIAEKVNAGIIFNGMYLKVMNDITLSDTWAGIGALKEGATSAVGSTVNGFAGTLFGAKEDGSITITIPDGRPGLLNYSNASTVKNLSVYGTNIVGSAIVNNSYTNYGTDDDYNLGINPDNITIENVTLKSGSHTTGAGLARGGGSGANSTNILNCVVESGVTIGSADTERVGSFVAILNGKIFNSTSAATVYGTNAVGGLAGHKGETMGACTISNSSFNGKVIATGNWVGGLIGRGYSDARDGGLNDNTTAPNTPVVTIANSYVSGSVTGADYVGGLFGGEPVIQDCWANGAGSIRNNVFYGTITATGNNVGAVVGYMNSMNANQSGMNNYYLDTCGVSNGFGKVNIKPADFDASTLSTAKTAVEMANGTVTDLLNASETSYKNWVQGTLHPELSKDPVAYYMQIGGTYKTEYQLGEDLDLTGMELAAVWSDGNVTYPTLEEVEIKGYDKNTRGQQTVTLTYGAITAQIPVTVLMPEGQIEVSFTLLGDDKHGTAGSSHTLADNNLKTWIAEKKYTISNNATVLDLLDMVLVANNMSYTNSSGNYIDTITNNDVTLAEFDNGANSGWMFTLNGVHGLLGVSEQYMEDGDVIVFHYTDDYTKEKHGAAASLTPEDVMALIDAIGEVTLDSEDAITTAREGYISLSEEERSKVTNYNALLAAEKALKELKGESSEEEDKFADIYKATGDYLEGLADEYDVTVASIGGEWLVLGLARSDRDVPAEYYDNVVEYVKANIDEKGRLHNTKSTENSRVILALTAAGYDVTNVGRYNLLDGLSDMSFVKKQGINGPIWALIALDSHDYEIPENADPETQVTREKLIDTILAAQLADGGWALSGTAADSDMTGMALQALAPYYDTNDKVKAAVDKALEALSNMQEDNGAFATGGAMTSESTAQVVVALTALGINPDTDERFIKNGVSALDALAAYYVEGGGFKHIMSGEINGMATEQGYYALAAYYRFLEGGTTLYDMSDVTIETAMGGQPGDSEDEEETGKPEDSKDEEEKLEDSKDEAEKPEDSKENQSSKPDTGDDTPIWLYAIAAMVSFVAVYGTYMLRKKEQ